MENIPFFKKQKSRPSDDQTEVASKVQSPRTEQKIQESSQKALFGFKNHFKNGANALKNMIPSRTKNKHSNQNMNSAMDNDTDQEPSSQTVSFDDSKDDKDEQIKRLQDANDQKDKQIQALHQLINELQDQVKYWTEQASTNYRLTPASSPVKHRNKQFFRHNNNDESIDESRFLSMMKRNYGTNEVTNTSL